MKSAEPRMKYGLNMNLSLIKLVTVAKIWSP